MFFLLEIWLFITWSIWISVHRLKHARCLVKPMRIISNAFSLTRNGQKKIIFCKKQWGFTSFLRFFFVKVNFNFSYYIHIFLRLISLCDCKQDVLNVYPMSNYALQNKRCKKAVSILTNYSTITSFLCKWRCSFENVKLVSSFTLVSFISLWKLR